MARECELRKRSEINLNIFDKIMGKMTLEEKVGQMFIARCPEINSVQKVKEYNLGGYILFSRDFSGKTRDEIIQNIQSYQSAVTTAANNNYGTQWISTNTAPKVASTVLIKVTKTVDVLSAPDGQKLDQQVEAGSEFVVIASKYYNGNLYYEISNGKWIMAKYTTQEAQITAKSGVLTINSKPDYGVPVWRVPGQDQIAGKFLKDGSSWRYFRVANVQGQTWYDLGGNQWVSAKSVLVR